MLFLLEARPAMSGLTTDSVSTACRMFFNRAYPNGQNAVPLEKQLFLDLPPGQELSQYHAHNAIPGSCFQLIKNPAGEIMGYALRLGSTYYPHLKVKVLAKDHDGEVVWVFAVDTHDAFSAESFRPPSDHPDAEQWMEIQEKNNKLKRQVEDEWEAAGIMTFSMLLRQGLNRDNG